MKHLLLSTAFIFSGAGMASAQIAFTNADISIGFSQTTRDGLSYGEDSYITGRSAYTFGNLTGQIDVTYSNRETPFSSTQSGIVTFHGGYRFSDAFRMALFGRYGESQTIGKPLRLLSAYGIEADYQSGAFGVQGSYEVRSLTLVNGGSALNSNLFRLGVSYDFNDQLEVYGRYWHQQFTTGTYSEDAYRIGMNYRFENAPVKASVFYERINANNGWSYDQVGVNFTYEFGPNAGAGLWDLF